MIPATEEATVTPYELLDMGFYLFPVSIYFDEAKNKWEKQPLVPWKKESTNDRKRIEWWSTWKNRNAWGIDCGKSGIAVIDVDSGKVSGAIERLEGLEWDNGQLPRTLTVRTRTGGSHQIYRGAIRNSASAKLGNGLDTRGPGGYIVAAGSPGYEVVDDSPIAEIPQWVCDLVGRPLERKEREPVDIEYDTPYAIERATHFLTEEADPAIENCGGNHHTLMVARHLHDLGVSEGMALELMLDLWNDSCCPVWAPEELQTVVRNAYYYANEKPGRINCQLVFDEVTIEDDPAVPPRFQLLTTYDVDKFAPLSWRIKGLIPSRGVFQIYGPRSSGKSFLTFDMLAAIAEGREWFGRKTKPTTVLYVCLEGEAGLRQRKDAWELHNGRRLPDNFLMLAQPWSIITKKDIIDLANVVPKGAVVVIDTQNRAAPSINESASEDMGQVIEGAKMLERLIKGAVGLVAHTGKDTTRGVRGHSSQEAAMDAVIEVSRTGDIRKWRTAKVKDGSDGEEGTFGLKVIKVGTDEDGDDITSCVIDLEVMVDVDGQEGFDLEPNAAAAWASIKMLVSTSKYGGILEDDWRADFYENRPKAGKNLFAQKRDELKEKGLVAKRDGLWVVNALTPAYVED